MHKKFFGTDGIRGRAGKAPLDAATVSQIGSALALTLKRDGASPLVVAGCDTRESSEWIVEALAGGVLAASGRFLHAGVIPTPGVAFLTTRLSADAGVVVSASHNPWQDNGIKIFGPDGKKLPDAIEATIASLIPAQGAVSPAPIPVDALLAESYLAKLASTASSPLAGLTIAIDAANGAASLIGPEAFRRAGATVIALNTAPDGHNINAGCGAVHPQGMARAVTESGADFGIALDGDADRIVMADDRGRILDGDDLLYLFTLELEREGRRPPLVVGTVMSNFGLEEALRKKGIALLRAPVGDRYVSEEMLRTGAPLGGEQSGHIIHSDFSSTGDGVLTGLVVSSLVASSGHKLSMQPRIERTPQILKNVKVRERVPFDSIPGLAAQQLACEALLNGHGRILLRYSGTEALARVMVEGTEASVVETVANRLVSVLETALGTAHP